MPCAAATCNRLTPRLSISTTDRATMFAPTGSRLAIRGVAVSFRLVGCGSLLAYIEKFTRKTQNSAQSARISENENARDWRKLVAGLWFRASSYPVLTFNRRDCFSDVSLRLRAAIADCRYWLAKIYSRRDCRETSERMVKAAAK